MDLPLLQSLVEEAKKTSNYAPVIRLIGSVWGSPDSLTISFLKSPKLIPIDGTDCGLDMEQVRKAYEIIQALVIYILFLLVIISAKKRP